MKLTVIVAFFSLFSFSTTDTLLKMVNAVYLPDPEIKVEGTDEQDKPLVLEYDKKTNTLIKYSDKKENGEKLTDFDLFYKLFFFSSDHTDEETMKKATDNIAELLKKNGVKIDRCIVSVQYGGSAPVISIGKEKRFSNANELAVFKDSFLPSHLTINEKTYVFSDYHKSVLPAAFPGKIEFYENDNLIKTWKFYRLELRQ